LWAEARCGERSCDHPGGARENQNADHRSARGHGREAGQVLAAGFKAEGAERSVLATSATTTRRAASRASMLVGRGDGRRTSRYFPATGRSTNRRRVRDAVTAPPRCRCGGRRRRRLAGASPDLRRRASQRSDGGRRMTPEGLQHLPRTTSRVPTMQAPARSVAGCCAFNGSCDVSARSARGVASLWAACVATSGRASSVAHPARLRLVAGLQGARGLVTATRAGQRAVWMV
jgi:hypothetical protein